MKGKAPSKELFKNGDSETYVSIPCTLVCTRVYQSFGKYNLIVVINQGNKPTNVGAECIAHGAKSIKQRVKGRKGLSPQYDSSYLPRINRTAKAFNRAGAAGENAKWGKHPPSLKLWRAGER